MKKVLKVIGIVLLCLVLAVAVGVGVYCYTCTHYWQGDLRKTMRAGFEEKQVVLDDGSVINYAEGPDNGAALLLIHGQTGAWEDYTSVLPELSKKWHVFAVDCYGHGSSSHDSAKYYIDVTGDDLIWFTNNVIAEDTVVSGHSSGGLIAAYIAAYGGDKIVGAVLEDPPVFSTEEAYFEQSFAYVDTYKVMHEYLSSEQDECWEAFYLRRCLWGQLYMADAMDGMADQAQAIYNKNPGAPVQFPYLPGSLNQMFLYVNEYDFQFGENFYNYSWHSGIAHEQLMSDIKVPTVFLHALDAYSEDGILMAASSNEQAQQAIDLIADCEKVELTSSHDIHQDHPDVFIDAVNSMLDRI